MRLIIGKSAADAKLLTDDGDNILTKMAVKSISMELQGNEDTIINFEVYADGVEVDFGDEIPPCLDETVSLEDDGPNTEGDWVRTTDQSFQENCFGPTGGWVMIKGEKTVWRIIWNQTFGHWGYFFEPSRPFETALITHSWRTSK